MKCKARWQCEIAAALSVFVLEGAYSAYRRGATIVAIGAKLRFAYWGLVTPIDVSDYRRYWRNLRLLVLGLYSVLRTATAVVA